MTTPKEQPTRTTTLTTLLRALRYVIPSLSPPSSSFAVMKDPQKEQKGGLNPTQGMVGGGHHHYDMKPSGKFRPKNFRGSVFPISLGPFISSDLIMATQPKHRFQHFSMEGQSQSGGDPKEEVEVEEEEVEFDIEEFLSENTREACKNVISDMKRKISNLKQMDSTQGSSQGIRDMNDCTANFLALLGDLHPLSIQYLTFTMKLTMNWCLSLMVAALDKYNGSLENTRTLNSIRDLRLKKDLHDCEKVCRVGLNIHHAFKSVKELKNNANWTWTHCLEWHCKHEGFVPMENCTNDVDLEIIIKKYQGILKLLQIKNIIREISAIAHYLKGEDDVSGAHFEKSLTKADEAESNYRDLIEVIKNCNNDSSKQEPSNSHDLQGNDVQWDQLEIRARNDLDQLVATKISTMINLSAFRIKVSMAVDMHSEVATDSLSYSFKVFESLQAIERAENQRQSEKKYIHTDEVKMDDGTYTLQVSTESKPRSIIIAESAARSHSLPEIYSLVNSQIAVINNTCQDGNLVVEQDDTVSHHHDEECVDDNINWNFQKREDDEIQPEFPVDTHDSSSVFFANDISDHENDSIAPILEIPPPQRRLSAVEPFELQSVIATINFPLMGSLLGWGSSMSQRRALAARPRSDLLASTPLPFMIMCRIVTKYNLALSLLTASADRMSVENSPTLTRIAHQARNSPVKSYVNQNTREDATTDDLTLCDQACLDAWRDAISLPPDHPIINKFNSLVPFHTVKSYLPAGTNSFGKSPQVRSSKPSPSPKTSLGHSKAVTPKSRTLSAQNSPSEDMRRNWPSSILYQSAADIVSPVGSPYARSTIDNKRETPPSTSTFITSVPSIAAPEIRKAPCRHRILVDPSEFKTQHDSFKGELQKRINRIPAAVKSQEITNTKETVEHFQTVLRQVKKGNSSASLLRMAVGPSPPSLPSVPKSNNINERRKLGGCPARPASLRPRVPSPSRVMMQVSLPNDFRKSSIDTFSQEYYRATIRYPKSPRGFPRPNPIEIDKSMLKSHMSKVSQVNRARLPLDISSYVDPPSSLVVSSPELLDSAPVALPESGRDTFHSLLIDASHEKELDLELKRLKKELRALLLNGQLDTLVKENDTAMDNPSPSTSRKIRRRPPTIQELNLKPRQPVDSTFEDEMMVLFSAANKRLSSLHGGYHLTPNMDHFSKLYEGDQYFPSIQERYSRPVTRQVTLASDKPASEQSSSTYLTKGEKSNVSFRTHQVGFIDDIYKSGETSLGATLKITAKDRASLGVVVPTAASTLMLPTKDVLDAVKRAISRTRRASELRDTGIYAIAVGGRKEDKHGLASRKDMANFVAAAISAAPIGRPRRRTKQKMSRKNVFNFDEEDPVEKKLNIFPNVKSSPVVTKSQELDPKPSKKIKIPVDEAEKSFQRKIRFNMHLAARLVERETERMYWKQQKDVDDDAPKRPLPVAPRTLVEANEELKDRPIRLRESGRSLEYHKAKRHIAKSYFDQVCARVSPVIHELDGVLSYPSPQKMIHWTLESERIAAEELKAQQEAGIIPPPPSNHGKPAYAFNHAGKMSHPPNREDQLVLYQLRQATLRGFIIRRPWGYWLRTSAEDQLPKRRNGNKYFAKKARSTMARTTISEKPTLDVRQDATTDLPDNPHCDEGSLVRVSFSKDETTCRMPSSGQLSNNEHEIWVKDGMCPQLHDDDGIRNTCSSIPEVIHDEGLAVGSSYSVPFSQALPANVERRKDRLDSLRSLNFTLPVHMRSDLWDENGQYISPYSVSSLSP